MTSSDFNENQPMEGSKMYNLFNFVCWYPSANSSLYPKVDFVVVVVVVLR